MQTKSSEDIQVMQDDKIQVINKRNLKRNDVVIKSILRSMKRYILSFNFYRFSVAFF